VTRAVEAALRAGAEHHRAGRWVDAARAYADALRQEPDNVDAAALLGAVLLRLDRAPDAVALLTRAHARAPDHALTALNLGRALLATANPAGAERAFAAALLARPGFADAIAGRCRALLALGRPDDALPLAQSLGDPSLLAAAQLARGDDGSAIATLTAALAEAPLPARARVAADLAHTHVHAGGRALAGGDPATAASHFAAALPDARAALALCDTLFRHPDLVVSEDTLLALLDRDDLDHQRLAATLARALRGPGLSPLATENPTAEPGYPRLAPDSVGGSPSATGIRPRFSGDSRGPSPLEQSPLFAPWLRRTIVVDADLNAQLADLRARWADDNSASVEALEALALQAWWTEYATITTAREDGPQPRPPFPYDATGSRRSTRDERWDPLRAALTAPPTAPTGLPRLDRAVFEEPAQEHALLAEVPHAGTSRVLDATSIEVAAMYESNPYPRLVGFHRRVPTPFDQIVPTSVPHHGPRRVLVAGGGTGQHPLQLASGLADAEVLSVDLSARSLARTLRLATKHGIANLRVLQADLLALGDIGRFDWIDCVGVLHHLAEPLAGGRALVERLVPGGLLRLGLYSERGRRDVVTARARVQDLTPDDAGLNAARARLLDLPGLTHSVDFWSQSGLRDLVFHPCEHRYSPLGVADLLARLGLSVVSLQHARPEPEQLFRARWPAGDLHDLALWDTLEADEPWIFAGMIHVWAQA
jgi:SAM-dependent methyltransferase